MKNAPSPFPVLAQDLHTVIYEDDRAELLFDKVTGEIMNQPGRSGMTPPIKQGSIPSENVAVPRNPDPERGVNAINEALTKTTGGVLVILDNTTCGIDNAGEMILDHLSENLPPEEKARLAIIPASTEWSDDPEDYEHYQKYQALKAKHPDLLIPGCTNKHDWDSNDLNRLYDEWNILTR